MKNKKQNIKKVSKHSKERSNKITKRKVLMVILIIVLCVSIAYVIYHFYSQWKNKNLLDELSDFVEVPTSEENKQNKDEEFLQKLQELKQENSDLVGWLTIDGTDVNYPVLQTDNNDFYVNHNFEKEYNELGSIFLDKDCSIQKPTANFLIYGHRSNGGQMFESLTKYKEKDFYEEHPTFQFATLDEVSEYEIIAVFQSQVYLKSQDVFKYYFFKDAANEQEFNQYIQNVKELSLYEIDATASYGEQLITLSTCDYHVEDGRFAIVAKKLLTKD